MSKRNVEYITHHPELERYVDEIGRPTRFGEALTLVGGHFGTPVDNDDLVSLALTLGLSPDLIEKTQKAITATGFTRRYFSTFPGEEIDISMALDRVTEIGAVLLSRAIKSQGWDSCDVFIDTSAFLPVGINQAILDRLKLSDTQVVSRSYRYACAGAVGAFIDCLSDPSLRDARVVIGALEPLSLVISREQFLSPDTIAFPSIFGDANTFLAFSPNRFHLTNKEILIQPDGGVIKLDTLYRFEDLPHDDYSVPDHYSFAGDGRNIFSYSDQGAFLNIPAPDNGQSVSMDGMATGFFFGDKTSTLLAGLLSEYGDRDLLKKLGEENLIMHPASKPVVDRIAKLLYRGKYRYLDSPSIPFLMDKAGYSNGSSATTLNRWRFMIENDMLDPEKPMVWLAPGIGSAIAGAIGWVNPY